MSLGNNLLNLVPNPFAGLISAGGTLNNPTVQAGQLLLPHPEWLSVEPVNAAWGNSEYDALQVMLQKRFTNGTSMIAGYTWSKTMADLVDGRWNDAGSIFTNGGDRSWYCRTCEHAVSSYDVPHRFVFSTEAGLPFGRGKRWGSGWHGVTNQFLGGWQVNGLLTLASGMPIVFYVATNNTYSFGGGEHPNLVGNPNLGSQQRINEWFNTGAFTQPANFTFGNLGRTVTSVRQDWTKDLDASLFKNFNILEKIQLQLRAEAYNFSNTPIMGTPGTTLGSSSFGVVGSQSNSARTVQLALKVLF